MDKKHIFICEDSLEGILTGVYAAWDARVGHGNVELRTEEEGNLELFCEYHPVEPDLLKAEKVLRTMRKKLGERLQRISVMPPARQIGRRERRCTALWWIVCPCTGLPMGRSDWII